MLTLEEEKNRHSKSEFYTYIFIPSKLLLKIFTVMISPFHIIRILLAYAAVMFILSTTHVALAISELLQGFVFEERDSTRTPGGPAVFYRVNVFPKRKAIYIVNVCPLFYFRLLFDLLIFIFYII